MRKLFAMEDIDDSVVSGELVTSPEEGEMAVVQVEIEPEVSEIITQSNVIDEAIDSVDQMTEVQSVLSNAIQDAEEVSPVATEAVRLAIDSICSRLGTTSAAVYSLESISGDNGKIALESVSEFIKDIWKKVKAALTSLWEKVKSFYDTHVSSLGRAKKSIESMKKRVGESSGKIVMNRVDSAPASLKTAFPSQDDINTNLIENYIKAHEDSSISRDEFSKMVEAANNQIEKNIKSDTVNLMIDFFNEGTSDIYNFGTKDAPLVSGVYKTIEITGDRHTGDLEITTETDKIDSNGDVGLIVSDKQALINLLKKTNNLIEDSIKLKEKLHKLQEAVNKITQIFDTKITDNEADFDEESLKEARKVIKIFYKLNNKSPTVMLGMINYNVQLTKAVLSYTHVCLKHFK